MPFEFYRFRGTATAESRVRLALIALCHRSRSSAAFAFDEFRLCVHVAVNFSDADDFCFDLCAREARSRDAISHRCRCQLHCRAYVIPGERGRQSSAPLITSDYCVVGCVGHRQIDTQCAAPSLFKTIDCEQHERSRCAHEALHLPRRGPRSGVREPLSAEFRGH